MRTDFQNSFANWFVVKFSMYRPQRFPPHLQCVVTLPCENWKSKNVADFDSILNKLLTCSLGHFMALRNRELHARNDDDVRTLWGLGLTFNSSWTDCLKTVDTEWLTNIFKFVRRRLVSTVKRCSVEHCCIMAILFTMIIFAPSSFCLGYTSYVVHIFK